jgi:hypothetical protein
MSVEKKVKIKNFDLSPHFIIDDVQRSKNTEKSINKKFQYEFSARTSEGNVNIGRLTVYANDTTEATKRAKKEIHYKTRFW